MKTLILAVALLAPSLPPSGGMRLLAKRKAEISVHIVLESKIESQGANESAVRNQAEVALRRCGLAVAEDAVSTIFINASALNHEGRGYSGSVVLQGGTYATISGEFVFVDAYTDSVVFAGPPGVAGTSLRAALAELLDEFCNSYLKARAIIAVSH